MVDGKMKMLACRSPLSERECWGMVFWVIPTAKAGGLFSVVPKRDWRERVAGERDVRDGKDVRDRRGGDDAECGNREAVETAEA
jgi:hypothetical protein